MSADLSSSRNRVEGLRCLRCRGLNLSRSGRDPSRLICDDCNANFIAVMRMVEVPPEEDRVLEPNIVTTGTGTTQSG